ncbi:hypothetical protein HZ994_16460 [Akkermansiaceae bacterium]|nr:hypothetical protein HZ994_16460 [Akkermansiaceae bacterium]
MKVSFTHLWAALAVVTFSNVSLAEEEPAFGDKPSNSESVELARSAWTVYRDEGMDAALRFLDTDGRAYIRKSDALARFDFFSMLNSLALFSKEREDPVWSAGVVGWIYRYGRFEGENYWYRNMVPEMYQVHVSAGRYGAAREVINYEMTRLSMDGRTEVEISRFKVLRPLMEDFPGVMLRRPHTEIVNWRNMDFLASVAALDLAEGKWARALEECSVAQDHAVGNIRWHAERPTLQDSEVVIDQLTALWRKGCDVEAEVWDFLGLPELEMKSHTEVAQYRAKKGWDQHYVLFAECQAAHLGFVLGKKDASVVADLNALQAELKGTKRVLPDDLKNVSLLIADIHLRSGNAEPGWQIINGMRKDPAVSANMKFRADREWCRHRVRTGALEEVEPALLALLETARSGGIKREEIDLYRIYSDFLIASGRYEDALRIQNELLRLLRAFNVYPRIPEALYGLAKIRALMGQKLSAEEALAEASEKLDAAKIPAASAARIRATISTPLPAAEKEDDAKPRIDLQPRRSMMVPLAGLPSRGLFSLTNPSGAYESGNLTLTGPGLSARHDADAGQLFVQLGTTGGQPRLVQPLTLAPGSTVLVDFLLDAAKSDAAQTVEISWQPNGGGAEQKAVWSTDKPEAGVSMAVTDASEYLDNPFYLIPVYHLIQYQDDFEQAVDFRVVASQPTRVEMYDQGEQMVFVDAEGDGSFASEGDSISQDLNRNGEPDLRLEASGKERRFMLFVRPVAELKAKDLDLEIQVKIQGEWQTYSTDRIVGAK